MSTQPGSAGVSPSPDGRVRKPLRTMRSAPGRGNASALPLSPRLSTRSAPTNVEAGLRTRPWFHRGSAPSLGQVLQRVLQCAVEVNLEVEVRARAEARATGLTDRLTRRDAVADRDVAARQMPVQGFEA